MCVANSAGAPGTDDGPLLALLHAIASRSDDEVARRLRSTPALATAAVQAGASRREPDRFFLDEIRHHVYRGDTALHVAAAASATGVAEMLMAAGADVRARNRRGAEPLHYAADGSPGAVWWNPRAQGEMIGLLIERGADANALDGSGVGPLHRAVRTRSSAAVQALIEGGADPRLANGRGSTPLHLAVQTTGRSGSGSEQARQEQRRVIVVLLAHGASVTDTDASGRTVAAAASSDWVRDILGPL